MSYQSDRERFFQAFGREFGNGTVTDARMLLRWASAEQRWNEVQCSIDIGETQTAREEKLSENRIKRARALLDKLGADLDVNGDPRGWPFRIIKREGGRVIGVPGRGLPARFFQ